MILTIPEPDYIFDHVCNYLGCKLFLLPDMNDFLIKENDVLDLGNDDYYRVVKVEEELGGYIVRPTQLIFRSSSFAVHASVFTDGAASHGFEYLGYQSPYDEILGALPLGFTVSGVSIDDAISTQPLTQDVNWEVIWTAPPQTSTVPRFNPIMETPRNGLRPLGVQHEHVGTPIERRFRQPEFVVHATSSGVHHLSTTYIPASPVDYVTIQFEIEGED